MTFDEQLRRAFDTLTDRLRDEMASHLEAATSELTSSAEAERAALVAGAVREAREAAEKEAAGRLSAAMAAAEERHREAEERAREEVRSQKEEVRRQKEEGRAEGREAGKAEGREEGREEGRRQGRDEGRTAALDEARQAADKVRDDAIGAAVERFVEAVRAIDRGRSLTEILDALAGCAAREARRAGVLLVRGDTLRAWRFRGFGDLDEHADFDLPMADAGLVALAVRSGLVASASGAPDAEAPLFAALPGGREAVAVPMSLDGAVVAVLYADEGAGEADTPLHSTWPATVEALTRHAAKTLEAMTAIRTAQIAELHDLEMKS